jgi:hypothetical protein
MSSDSLAAVHRETTSPPPHLESWTLPPGWSWGSEGLLREHRHYQEVVDALGRSLSLVSAPDESHGDWLKREARALAHRNHPSIPTTYHYWASYQESRRGPGYLRRWISGETVRVARFAAGAGGGAVCAAGAARGREYARVSARHRRRAWRDLVQHGLVDAGRPLVAAGLGMGAAARGLAGRPHTRSPTDGLTAPMGERRMASHALVRSVAVGGHAVHHAHRRNTAGIRHPATRPAARRLSTVARRGDCAYAACRSRAAVSVVGRDAPRSRPAWAGAAGVHRAGR